MNTFNFSLPDIKADKLSDRGYAQQIAESLYRLQEQLRYMAYNISVENLDSDAQRLINTFSDNVTRTTKISADFEGFRIEVDNHAKETSAQIKVVADSIASEVTRATGAEGELRSSIKQTADSITSEVIRATEAEETLKSSIKQTADSIASEVTRATGAEGALRSSITQNADSITSEVTRATAAEGNLSSRISQTESSISLKVSKGNISSELSMESGQITLDSNRLIVRSSQFVLDGNGNATFKGNVAGAQITGSSIYSNGGLYGSVSIDEGYIFLQKNSSQYAQITSTGADYTNGQDRALILPGDLEITSGSATTQITPFAIIVNGSPVVTQSTLTGLSVQHSAYADSANSAYSSAYADNLGNSGQYAYIGPQTGGLVPNSDGTVPCGTRLHRWSEIYAATPEINASDLREKEAVCPVPDLYDGLFFRLSPVSYKFVNGSSGRTHIGFIAQEVEAAMLEAGISDKDFAGFIKTPVYDTQDGGYCEGAKLMDYAYGLRYQEFIALNTKMIQRLFQRVTELEGRIGGLHD